MEDKFSWFHVLFYAALGVILLFATFTIMDTRYYPYLLFVLIGCFLAERILWVLFYFIGKSLVTDKGSINTDMAHDIVFDFLKISAMMATIMIVLGLLILWRTLEPFLTGVLITILATTMGALLTLRPGWDKKSRSGGN